MTDSNQTSNEKKSKPEITRNAGYNAKPLVEVRKEHNPAPLIQSRYILEEHNSKPLTEIRTAPPPDSKKSKEKK